MQGMSLLGLQAYKPGKQVLYCVTGFYFLFKNYQGDTQSDFATVGDTVMTLFEMTLGEYKVYSANLSVCPSVCPHVCYFTTYFSCLSVVIIYEAYMAECKQPF